MAAPDHFAALLLQRLAWTSLQAALLAGAIALLCRALPRLPAAARCVLWWLVALQAVLGLAWYAPIELPLLVAPAAQEAAPAAAVLAVSPGPDASPAVRLAPRRTADVSPAMPGQVHAPSWRGVVAALWLAGLLAQLPTLLRQGLRTRALLRGAAPLDDPALQALCARQAQAMGLRRCPPLRVSAAIASPQVVGLRRPVVLLPAGHALNRDEAALALAHELAHLRRGDLWLGWLPALAQWLLFFHPLLRWAMREYALEREAACDAQVLRYAGGAAQDYGRLLLRLGVAHPLHAGLAGASPTFRNLKRRLTMLQFTDMPSRQRLYGWLLVAVVALAGVLPYRVTAHAAKEAQPSPAATVAQAAAATPVARPAATPRAAAGAVDVDRNGSRQAAPGAAVPAPPPPAAPLPPLPPAPPAPPPTPPKGYAARHVDIDTYSNARNGFALYDGDTITVNGTQADLGRAERLHRASGGPLLWVRRGDQAYVIRDKATMERAKAIYAPVTALAREQGRLAGQQGALAGRQAGLAARDAALAQEQAALAQRQAEAQAQNAQQRSAELLRREAQAQQRATEAQQRALEREAEAQRRDAEAQQRALEREQAQLEQRQAGSHGDLDAQRKALEAQQQALEQQQRALEQRQQQADRAAQQAMGRLIDEALAKGLAEDASRR